uniref:Uncharacterized protein n=1 Tax=Melopsittacus undulatus TaxID=13146 RepID=A0A8V5G431_MELUD
MGQKVSHKDNPQNKNYLGSPNSSHFCLKKGMEEGITTGTMTKQQPSLFGVDWIWTLSGADKQIKLQLAMQALQLAELFHILVGWDCLGLFIMFSIPGKPKDIQGVMLDSIAKEEQNYRLSGRDALWQFGTSTDGFLLTRHVGKLSLEKANQVTWSLE